MSVREAASGPDAVDMSVIARRADADAFASFGAFLQPPKSVGERAHFGRWMEPVPGLTQQCHVNRVAVAKLPLCLDRVERHPLATQLFLPMGVSRYLVTVMPSDDAGAPDPAGAMAFIVPGTWGVAYRPNTWHAGISVLDREGSFSVLMWRGSDEDDVFQDIAPLVVRETESHDA